MWRQLLVDVREHFPPVRLRHLFASRNLLQDLSPEAFDVVFLVAFVPPAALRHVVLQLVNGVLSVLPALDLLGGPVRGAVVGRGMVADPIRHGLDDARLVPLQTVFAGRFGRVVNGEHVGAVDADRRDPIRRRPSASDAIARELLRRGRGDRIPIIPTARKRKSSR